MPGRVRQADDAHLVAGLGAPLGARHHGGAEPPGLLPRLHAAGKLGPGLESQRLQQRRVVVERMAGEEEADGIVLALQLVGRHPHRRRRDLQGLRRRRPAEDVALPALGRRVGALRGRQHRLDGREGAGAVGLDAVEGAGRREILQHPLVDLARIDAMREVREVAERPLAASRHDGLHRLPADALDGGERVEDRVAVDVEVDARAVDRRRRHRDAEPLRLRAEIGELVGVAHVEGHRGGQELDRIVRLEVGGLVRDQRVGGRVALVEAVVGELGQELEDGLGLRGLDPTLDRPLAEQGALLVHLGADLLAHGAAQEVGLAERVAGQHLGDLHHLLLVDDDPEGLAQDRLELGMDVVGALLPVLAGAVGRDVGHRARPVERHERHQILQPIGPHVDQGAAHAGAFHLEHADRLAARQHVVGLLVVDRDVGEIDVDATPPQQLHGGVEGGQRLQAEEVELHEARLLHPFHVELGDRHVGLRVAIERHQLVEMAVADDDAGGVRRGVAVEPLQLLGDREGARHHRLGVAGRLKLRLSLDRLLQADGLGRVLRDELAQLVDLAVRHLQHAADVAQHAARLERAEGDDLGDVITPVALLNVVDHLAAAILAEVDVEVRHRHALGIEEALEQQAEADRIKIRDGERPGHHRAGPGAAARADRNAVPLRPLDEVRDDQEVAREAHAGDDAELVGEPLAIVLLGVAGRAAMRREALRQALGGTRPHGRLLVQRLAGLGPVVGQDGLAGARAIRAAPGDLDRRRQRLGEIGEQRRHLGPRLEAVLGGEMAPLGLGEQPPLGDAQQRVVGLVIVGRGEERLVGGDQRHARRIGEIDQRPLGGPLGLGAVTLQLDIEAVAEQALQGRQAGGGERRLARHDGAVERAVGSARQGNQAIAMAVQPGERDVRRLVGGRLQEGARVEPHEVAVALLAGGQQHQPRQRAGVRAAAAGRLLVGEVDGERDADDRLDAVAGDLLGELQCTEQIVGVGESQRRLAVGLGERRELADRQRPFQQREGGMDVQMHEARIGGERVVDRRHRRAHGRLPGGTRGRRCRAGERGRGRRRGGIGGHRPNRAAIERGTRDSRIGHRRGSPERTAQSPAGQ
ncbi:hypothetical protein RHODGE_RHODGE_02480 [Rhodoplanes serenus]|uniref:Uncharacterized protein n=1 Tax=Rhodoplanes serenus TaxID=200615 RepID=A0A3S4DFV0_9BRAD|nr:hypothetical protein RHODGE_RHODGE_02480 [Rhodoplanes serenus]